MFKILFAIVILSPAIRAEKLELGKAVQHDLAVGKADQYEVALHAGEYCAGKVNQIGGRVEVVAYAPDGSRIRAFDGAPGGDKRFAFEAPVDGTYRIDLKAPEKNAAKSYEIKLEKIQTLEERLQSHVVPERNSSPRMTALRKEIESGNKDAIAAFWKEVELQGAPLVEPLEKNDREMLVTFLWRAKRETRNVLIVWYPFTSANPNDYKLLHLPDTDIWYRTLKIRKEARFVYGLSPNDPLLFDEAADGQRLATLRADPLNPHRWFDKPESSPLEYFSMMEMPGAPAQPYIKKRDAVPMGKVEKNHITSALLKNERDLSIYTPPGYEKTAKPYGLLFVFDESAYLNLVPTPAILDNLIAEKKIAPMVAVLIGNASGDARGRELPPNPDFADFLNNELMQWVRRNYNVTTDPSQIVIAGSSYGGIASVYAGFRHPETFGNILCQSGSFWWSAHDPKPYTEPNYLAKQFIASPKLPLKFYMDAGSFEVDMRGGGGAILEPSRHFRDVLLAKGYEVHYQENVGGHDYLSWRGTLADGLIALVGIK